jgi:hypothetical protein
LKVVESSYSIDQIENLVRLKVAGTLSAEGLTKLMRSIGEDPQYRSGMHALADFRECVGAWDYSDIQRFRDFVVRACGVRPRRWASLVRPGSIEAVGRVLIVISEAVEARIRMRLFESPDEALRWINGVDD